MTFISHLDRISTSDIRVKILLSCYKSRETCVSSALLAGKATSGTLSAWGGLPALALKFRQFYN